MINLSLIKYIPWRQLPWILVILGLGVAAFYFWREQVATEKLLSQKNEELQQANLALGRAQTTIVEQQKVHKIALQKLNDDIVKEIKARKALVMMYAELQAKYEAEKKKVKTITKIIYKDREVPIEPGTIFYKDPEGKYIPVTAMKYNYEDFRITIEGDAIKQELSYKLHQNFQVQIVETKLKSGGRNHYAKLYELNDKGERVGELSLTKFEVLRSEEMPAHFMWWNPKLDIKLGGGMNTDGDPSWDGDFGFSVMAYGVTDDDLSWRFLRAGVGITKFGFSLTGSPVQFNIGKYLPVISNLWVIPYVGYDFGAEATHIGAGLGVMF